MRILGLFLLSASAAFAQGAPAAPSGAQALLMQAPIFLAIFAMFYFVAIRPQRQQAKRQQEFMSSLKKGEEVFTDSGIIGKITGLTEKVIILEVDEGTELKVIRGQVRGYFKDAQTAQ